MNKTSYHKSAFNFSLFIVQLTFYCTKAPFEDVFNMCNQPLVVQEHLTVHILHFRKKKKVNSCAMGVCVPAVPGTPIQQHSLLEKHVTTVTVRSCNSVLAVPLQGSK